MQEAVDAYNKTGSKTGAAALLNLHLNTYTSRLRTAVQRGYKTIEKPEESIMDKLKDAQDKIRQLEASATQHQEEQLTAEYIKKKVIKLRDGKTTIPNWLVKKKEKKSFAGVPTLFASDWHWGEIVDPNHINGVNEYNMSIAQNRARTMIEKAIDLLKNYIANPNYPGIVFVLGGDMVSGDIHEELMATNEKEIMPTVLDLFGVLSWCIHTLAEEFGQVFVPCVSGNHGRNTHKIRNKGRNFTSFDWLLYQFLAKRFENDSRVTFHIPDGSDAYYSIFGHKYLLTHGDQFRGGDGVIGALGPIVRGDHRKRSRNSQIDMGYETMLLGHWHQLIQLERLIVNGCFPSGSKVTTNIGYNTIENISIGDKVMSKDGSEQAVTHVFKKKAETIIGLKIYGLPHVLQATPNHLIWASKRSNSINEVTPSRRMLIDLKHGKAQWIPMDFLSSGDYVHVPFPNGNEKPIDEQTAWAYGLFLAEGHALVDGGITKKHHRIGLTMHIKEKFLLEYWAEWFEKTYKGNGVRITERLDRNTSDLIVTVPRELALWFRETFGHGAINKKLPDGAFYWADNLKASLVKGWFAGDGHVAFREDSRPTISATSISENLAMGMFYLARATGSIPALSCLQKGGRRKNDAYTVHLNTGQHSIEINGELFYQVKERFETNQNIDVYDLEVSGEHTYAVNCVGVHNSLKGYDEYAYSNNFGFEPPRQAMWITHPDHGITFSIPIYVDRQKKNLEKEWITWK